jgi:hypothetical protein
MNPGGVLFFPLTSTGEPAPGVPAGIGVEPHSSAVFTVAPDIATAFPRGADEPPAEFHVVGAR